MKYGIVFATAAIIAGLHAFENPDTSIFLGWVAISFMIVAIAYLGILPKAFFKASDGIIPLWSKILNLPFLSYTVFVWHIYRLINRENPTNKISDDLVIGRRLLPKEVHDVFDVYIDLTAEFDEPKQIREKASYVCFPILDTHVPDIDDLMILIDKIDNKKVFIHCAQGHGRTGLVALAILMKKGIVDDVGKGVEYLQDFRPALGLSRNQIEYLEKNKNRIVD